MMLIGDQGSYGRVMVWLGGLGLAAAAAAFVPSPLGLFDLFQGVQPLEVKSHPPLQLQALPAIASYDVITTHPLFNTNRVPDPVAPVATSGGQPASGPLLGDLSQFKLVGIAGDSETRIALVQKAGGALQRLKPGDSLEGWIVTGIDARGVSISGGGRKEVLAIPRATNNAKSP
ncbi:MAG: hypothetical protein ABL973_19475 [Micropepsaceae bacterium]